MTDDYYTKYLKYKSKYINLKNNLMTGGGEQKDVMLFKAEWCGHCKQFLPVWNTIKEMPEFKNKFNFKTIDYDNDKEEISKWDVKEFPTLLIKNTDNDVSEYNGPREMEHMIEFFNSL